MLAERTERKTQEHASRDLSERELGCAVAAIYHEGRGESALGQAAIMHVIMNRVRPLSCMSS
jgi:spore germination cell wall hydrolase CwlJ-like protein